MGGYNYKTSLKPNEEINQNQSKQNQMNDRKISKIIENKCYISELQGL